MNMILKSMVTGVLGFITLGAEAQALHSTESKSKKIQGVKSADVRAAKAAAADAAGTGYSSSAAVSTPGAGKNGSALAPPKISSPVKGKKRGSKTRN